MAVAAAAAGVGIGTLYRRYPNREALLDALTRRSFRLVLDSARAAAAWPGNALDALAHFFGLTIASRGELILPLHGGPDPVTDATRSVRDEVHRTLQEIGRTPFPGRAQRKRRPRTHKRWLMFACAEHRTLFGNARALTDADRAELEQRRQAERRALAGQRWMPPTPMG
jgi:AcrR family transcriptional regulator